MIFMLILTALTMQLTGCYEISTAKTDEDAVNGSNIYGLQDDITSDTNASKTFERSDTISEISFDTTSETLTDDIYSERNFPQLESTPPIENETISEEETHKEYSTSAWIETALSGELYVNTNNIYSRIYAIQGSDKVKQYRLDDKVTVIAKTDTNYYKLSDGTFIHVDYLSEDKTFEETTENINDDYIAVSKNGYVIEMIDGITYVDGIMIANKTYSLPKSYDPGIREEAANALVEMQEAAAKEGLSLYVVSGYRSYQTQESVYAGWVNRDGVEEADTYSSRAGHSDHQTGYTFDLNSLEQSFAYTQEGIWLAKHCAEFGFIIRYPEGKEMYTGYVYEPWHVRYIGKEKAEIITKSGLSLEEYYGITSDYYDYTGE